MGTSTRIKLVHEGRVIAAEYWQMDGHVSNFAPKLILALQTIDQTDIVKVKPLLSFFAMSGLHEGGDDKWMDYLCEVDIGVENYAITVHGYGGKLLFQGSLEEFAQQYDKPE